jgi:hypothetical protein
MVGKVNPVVLIIGGLSFNSTRHHHQICQDANTIKDVYHIKCNVPDLRKYKHQLLTEINPDSKLPCYFDL